MVNEVYAGKAKSGSMDSVAPLGELIFFGFWLMAFLLVFTFIFTAAFPLTFLFAIPIWITGYTLFRLWSKSTVTIDREKDTLEFSQSLIFTPGITWRSESRSLSELTKIQVGMSSYSRQIDPDMERGLYESRMESDEAIGWNRMTSKEKSEVMNVQENFWQIYLTGYNRENEEWILDISDAALVGTNKVPNTKFINELCSMLGLPEPTLKEDKPQTLLPVFIILGVMISPGILITLDESFLNLNDILAIIFSLSIWILSFMSLVAYFVVRIILSVTNPGFDSPPLPEEGLPEEYKSRSVAKGEKVVKFNEKLSKMNKTLFLKELGLIFLVSLVISILAGAPSLLLVIFSVGLYQRWKAHTSEHALAGKCIHSVDGYPEGTNLKKWEKRWTKGPDSGWNCSQTPLAGESYCLVHMKLYQWRISDGRGNEERRPRMSLREEREQFIQEHSEIAKTLFGDRTDLTEDEWYDLAMAAGNPVHPNDK